MSSKQEFITLIAPAAVEIQKKFGLPAAALVAQVCLETGYGQKICRDKVTRKDSRNLFNIKGKGPAGSVEVFTKEYLNGAWVTKIAKFRAYNSFQESFEDYLKLILGVPRYRLARAQKEPLKYAYELQQAGYATDPDYWEKIGKIIELQQIDKLVRGLLAMGEIQQPAAWAVKAIEEVKKAGIMRGDPDGDFRPKDPVTREEMAVILANVKASKFLSG